jgi:hypothetical protein
VKATSPTFRSLGYRRSYAILAPTNKKGLSAKLLPPQVCHHPRKGGNAAARVHPELMGVVRKEATDIYDLIDKKELRLSHEKSMPYY